MYTKARTATWDWETDEKRARILRGEPGILTMGPLQWERGFQCALGAVWTVCVEGRAVGLAVLRAWYLVQDTVV